MTTEHHDAPQFSWSVAWMGLVAYLVVVGLIFLMVPR